MGVSFLAAIAIVIVGSSSDESFTDCRGFVEYKLTNVDISNTIAMLRLNAIQRLANILNDDTSKLNADNPIIAKYNGSIIVIILEVLRVTL